MGYVVAIVLLLIQGSQAFICAQEFGNEWIDYQKSYIKITTVQDGIYRLSYEDLEEFGVTQVDPRKLQLFHRGVEQTIYIEGEEDGNFGTTDFLEFYGKRNDGNLDTFLKIDPNTQTNKFYNNFSDATAFFLTWTLDNSFGKRMPISAATPSGDVSLFHWNESLQVFSEDFSTGQNYVVGSNEQIQDSFFDTGEGWMSTLISEGENRVIHFPVQNVYTNDDKLSPHLEILIAGDFQSVLPYKVSLEIGGAINNLVNQPFTFSAVSHQESIFNQAIDPNLLQNTNELIVRLSADQGDFRIVYAKLTYPQTWTVDEENKLFDLPTDALPENFASVRINNVSPGSYLYDLTDENTITRIIPQIVSGELTALIPFLTQPQ